MLPTGRLRSGHFGAHAQIRADASKAMLSKGDQDMQYQDDHIAYVFEVWAMRTLDVLRTQLYDDRPLSGGQRR